MCSCVVNNQLSGGGEARIFRLPASHGEPAACAIPENFTIDSHPRQELVLSSSYGSLTSFIIRNQSPGDVGSKVRAPFITPCFLGASLWLRASWEG